ncbi:aminopeptidase P family protein [Burkholderiaceae bacterium DAT-1]|nr:aminopeptidase P family protein [Burkholderiaceae bacterium DAT-1]
MFPAQTYTQRREALNKTVGTGIALFLGNADSPMNYADNIYHFRQDSSFLYFFGLDAPNLAAIIDFDAGTTTLFGDDGDIDSIVWTGPLPSLVERAAGAGITQVQPFASLQSMLASAAQAGRTIHTLPQYRADNRLLLASLLNVAVDAHAPSTTLIKAVVDLRAVKDALEIAEMENALEITWRMHMLAMRSSQPGVREQEVVGLMHGLANSQGRETAYPIIFSRDGHILHNHGHGYTLEAGNLVVNDAGAESPLKYASDITRTIPVGGRFTEQQKPVYQAVLDSQLASIAAMKPGVPFRDVYDLSARVIVDGLKALGLYKGDSAEAVAAGAHGLVYPHGLGHMIGLDVHDMEGLGENLVGYGEGFERSTLFGRKSLRLARPLCEGWVVTVEPGIYFIPALIDRWQAEGKFKEFINYEAFAAYRNFGGIRIEDDVLVTADGARVLGKPIAKTIEEVEAASTAL